MIPSQFQRTILWIVFGLSLLLLWDKWQQSNGRPSFFGPQVQQTDAAGQAGKTPGGPAPAGAANTGSVPGASSLPGSVPAASGAGAQSAALPAGTTAAQSGQILKLANDVLSLDVDTAGAQITRASMLEHHDAADTAQDVVLLQNVPGQLYLAQSGWTGGPAGGAAFPNHRSVFKVVEGPTQAAGGSESTITLEAESGGLKVQRTYTLKRGSYVVDVQDKVTNVGTQPVRPTLYMQLAREGFEPPGKPAATIFGHSFGAPYSTYTGPVIYTDKSKFHKLDFKSITQGKASYDKTASDGWIGIIQHYFVAAWLPTDKAEREYYAEPVDADLFRIGAKEVIPELAPGATQSVGTRLLLAPQDQKMLADTAPGLDLTVDYGWLTVIAKPIYALLSWLHSIVGNWGWSIVLLTIIIKTIFFPLQAASYKSMARMKAVTPRLTSLRERYKDDRQKLNTAMMELYKQEKINPLGGCLPVVVQIPVFISLYWVLLASVEIRNAPWIGWIHDLAAPDPYFVLPLIMAATMFLQTKMNPKPPDPVQAKMMMFMPLIFSVMFFFFPAGLVLYWLVNNCYSIVQQYLITRKFAPATPS